MVPEGWRKTELQDVGEVILGQSPPSAQVTEMELGLPFLQGNAEFGGRYPSPKSWVENPPRTAPPHSTLVSVRAPVGDVNRADVEYAIGRGLAAIVADEQNVLPDYLFWVLVNSHAHYVSRRQGSTFFAINKSDLKEIPVPLPPLPEQRKLAAVLSSVDDAIAAIRKVIEQTKRVKKGLLQTLMTCGIGHTQLKQTEIGEIPDEWEVAPMESLAVPGGMTGGPFGSDLTGSDYVEPPGVPVIRGSNVSPGHFHASGFVYVGPEKAAALQRNQAIPGDLVMTQRGASLGQAALIPRNHGVDKYIVSQTMMRMRPDHQKVVPAFLSHFVNGPLGHRWLERQAVSTGQPHLNLTIFRKMPMPVPPIAEQQEIADRLNTVETAANASHSYLEKLEALKTGLLQDLLTGRVRVQPD